MAVFFAVFGLGGCSGQALLNALTPTAGQERYPSLEYAPGLSLDIYRPGRTTPNRAGPGRPVVVFFHGGRWRLGDKEGYRFVGQALAARGILTVIPDYRHYPAVRFPAFVEDGAHAVAWVRRRIAAYGGDPSRIFVMGHSAGAHIAALLALNPSYLAAAGGDRDALAGMIGLAGPYDFLPLTDADLRDMFGPPERFVQSQPIHFVDGRNPPLLLLHGENDTDVRVRNTRELARAVAAAGGPVSAVIYPRMSHLRMIASLSRPLGWSADLLERIQDFVDASASRVGAPAEPDGGNRAQATTPDSAGG